MLNNKPDDPAQSIHPASPDHVLRLCTSICKTENDDLDGREALFAELDPILDTASDEIIESVLASSTFQAMKDTVHAIRAAYEYEREMELANDIIVQHNAKVAEAFRSHDWYDTALDFETKALAPFKRKRILFVGSGPFPTSPMAFLRNNPGAKVTCMERYDDACEKARAVADIFGLPELEIINSDGAEVRDFSAFDCVIVGLVVGAVDSHKATIVEHFLTHVPDDALLCFRSADGSGQVIYPSVDPKDLVDVPHTILEGPPHKSFTMIIVDRK
ncbi:MAG: nicotianamine synthase family protein [Pseudomonadota bacterium]